ncbi:MAG TPA: radical SAM protein [bacterium]|nr:radical SAM protein [bacterium]
MLKALDLEITGCCNEKCVHCYHPENISREFMKDMDLLDTMLQEFAELGFIFLTITGGEPLLHPEFRKIFETAQKHRYSISVKTNGTLIDDGTAVFFSEMKPETVEVSIYSSDSSEHDSITCIPGSFEKSMNGLKTMKRHGAKCSAHTPVIKGIKKWKELYDIMRSLDIPWSCSSNIFPSLDQRTSLEPLRNGYNEYLDFMKFTDQREKMPPPERTGECYNGCMAGISKVSIGPDFMLKPCLAWNETAGKYKPGEGADLIKRSRKIFENKLKTIECLECPLVKICIPCPAHLEIVHGKGICDKNRKEFAKAYCDFFELTEKCL